MIKPPALRKNDTIGIVAPSAPFDPQELARGLDLLRQMGFGVALGPHLNKQKGHLAGDDQERRRDLEDMFLRQEVCAVMAARGGFGALRLVHRLDYSLFAQNPKHLVGFSDMTVLLNTIAQRSGLITFHGPMVTSLAKVSPRSQHCFYSMLTSPELPPLEWEETEVLRPGQAEGRLMGGNLTTLCHLLGTPFEPDFRDSILILEDINEPFYRVDRMLTHLYLSGKLDRVRAVLLGDFSGCQDVEAVGERMLSLLPDSSIPVWANMPLGHGSNNYTWPIGSRARLLGRGRIRFSHEH